MKIAPGPIRNSVRTAVLGALMSFGGAALADQPPSEQQQIDALRRQLEAVQSQLKDLADQNRRLLEREQALEQQMAQSATAPTTNPAAPGVPPAANPAPVVSNPIPPSSNPVPPTVNPAVASSNPIPGGALALANAASPFGNGLKLWGYGEVYYTRPTRDEKEAQADLARAVFGIGYTFDSRTEFNSEFEVEHAVASATDPGEFEVEQFYIDREINQYVGLRAGLFLMPFGFLNEHHEPTNFYGVQRNFVETLIIPSTWREGGLNLHGDTGFGLGWNAGLTTGFDLSKWNFAPEFPLYTTALELEDSDSAPLQSTHQELALANAQHLSQYVALGYYGVPGLTIGGAISTGDAVKVAAPPNVPIPGNERVTLWEGHVRWTPAKWDLSAIYAHGSISNLAIANASNPDPPIRFPHSSMAITCRAPIRCGITTNIASCLSRVGNITTWARAMRAQPGPWSRPGSYRSRRTPEITAIGPSIMTACGRWARISTPRRTSCSRPTISGSSSTPTSAASILDSELRSDAAPHGHRIAAAACRAPRPSRGAGIWSSRRRARRSRR
jgi:hypothetical protein